MNWDNVKFFLAVARSGQLSAASIRLGVSQATISRRISAIETELDCRLFNRGTTGSELTPEGQELLGLAEEIEAGMVRLRSNSRRSTSEVSGTVRIGAPDGFGVAYLSRKLHLLAERYPQLILQLVPVPRSFSLSQREADVAVMIGRPGKGRLRIRKLTDYTLRLFASRSYLEEHGVPEVEADLGRHRLIGYVDDLIYSSELNFNTEFWSGWGSKIEIASALGQFEAVRSGAGIGVLHDFMACTVPDLVPVLTSRTLELAYWTAWHESMKDTRRVRVVAEFLDEIVKADRHLFVAC